MGTIGIGARITTLGGSATVGGDVTGVTGTGTFDIPIGPLTPRQIRRPEASPIGTGHFR